MKPWGVTAICIVLYSSPAAADWQYTKWGMTIEQAQRAATGKLRPPSPSELSGKSMNGTPLGLVGIHDAGNLHFSVGLYFNGPSGTLGLAHLVLLDGSQRYAAI